MKAMTPHSRNALPHKHPPAHVHTPEKFVGLDLSRMKLRALSPSIAIYSFLSELYLQFNNINILPVEMFSALTSLRVLGSALFLLLLRLRSNVTLPVFVVGHVFLHIQF
jgi:Leucine-rich repeat (LRR) protein